ncbi:hypothetical protein CNMCM8927_008747 [Aspergillus lentulus]|uniref:Heterokaryon incompatibility domain-containing protein n=1 Tax=Aspergillus lentulus TaxID=293939 RepID=A0AAN5YXF8_ASPLE|nr:hypothetical protein CNMCM8927_008747 [Aspergillus lentulus]
MEKPKKDDFVPAKTVQVEQKNNAHIYNVLPPDHIRILDLFPGSEYDLIEVQLHVAPIADPGKYQALSYVCGSTTDDLRLILCNNHEFMITSNLFDALNRFRSPTETRRLWVDAICIHQGSISERSQQVRMMSQIYEGAEEVLVWLGKDNPKVNIKRAFEVMSTRADYRLQYMSLDQPSGSAPTILCIPDPDLYDVLAEVQQRFDPPTWPDDCDPSLRGMVEQLLQQSWVDFPRSQLLMYIGCRHLDHSTQGDASQDQNSILWIMPDWDADHVRRMANENFATFTDFLKEATKPAEMRLSDSEAGEVFCAINDLFGRPYFQRAWIVQEIILSRKATLVCGQHEGDLESFWHVFGLDRLQSTYMQNFYLDDFHFFEAQKNVQKIFTWARSMKTPSHLSHLSRLTFKGHTVFNQMAYIRSSGRNGRLRLIDIGHLLNNFRKQKSTDPRDQIFSLVGLLQRFSKRPGVLQWAESCVDYSLGVRDIYLSTAQHIAENNHERNRGDTTSFGGSCHILSFFEQTIGPPPEQLDLPTWVPNWSAEREGTVFNTRRIDETASLIPYDARVQGESLVVSGCIVDKVTFCSDILGCNEQMFQEVDLCYMLTERERKKKTPSVYGAFKAQFEGFWRTIIADNPIGTKPYTDHTHHFQEQDAVNEWLTQCQHNYRQVRCTWSDELESRPILGPTLARVQGHDEGHAPSAEDGKVQTLLRRLDKNRLLELLELDEPRWGSLEARMEMSKHILIKTEQGYFGLAPPSVQIGDTVALLAACSHPWYLRRQDQHYTIVGKAWVHGLMYKNDSFYQSDSFRKNRTQIELR